VDFANKTFTALQISKTVYSSSLESELAKLFRGYFLAWHVEHFEGDKLDFAIF